MPQNIITNLAVGTKFLRMALGCMKSAHLLCGDRYGYVIFHAWCDLNQYTVPDYVKLVDIAPIISRRKTRSMYTDTYRTLDAAEVQADHFSARELKGIPFTHPDFTDSNMVFVDADVIVYEDRFETLFSGIVKSSVVTLGELIAPDVNLYTWPHADWTFNLQAQALLAGFDIKNRHVHTGIVGRASDDRGKFVSTVFDLLLQVKPLPLFPENVRYFNDEAYFALALSLAAHRFPHLDFHTINDLDIMKTTLGRTFLGLHPISGKPILGDPNNPEIQDTGYAILHFHTITQWDADFYHRWLDQHVPPRQASRKPKSRSGAPRVTQ